MCGAVVTIVFVIVLLAWATYSSNLEDNKPSGKVAIIIQGDQAVYAQYEDSLGEWHYFTWEGSVPQKYKFETLQQAENFLKYQNIVKIITSKKVINYEDIKHENKI